MTDYDLRDLLSDRVQHVTMPDVADVAWERARGIRHRRAVTAVAAVTVVVVLAGSALWSRNDDRSSVPVAPSPTPTTGPPTTAAPTPTRSYKDSGIRPDASYRGWPVYWGAQPGQEATLPRLDSPLPAEIDLAAPAERLEDAPISSALAAYTVTDTTDRQRLLLLAEDGSLRSVDVSRVRPLLVAGGQDVSVARETLLSPTGRFLAFPQEGSIEVLTLGTGEWRRIDTGSAPTAWLRWLGDSDLFLPPDRLGGQGPTYGVDGRRSGSSGMVVPPGPFDSANGVPTGRYRQGPANTAQTWTARVPVAHDTSRRSLVLVVAGFQRDDDALLVLGGSAQSPRPDGCCSVTFWLDNERLVYESPTDPRRLVAWRLGTHELDIVATLTGIEPGQHVVSSYVRVWG